MVSIPENFMVGTSSSGWQIEGNFGKLPDQKSYADLFYETDPKRWYEGVGPEKASDFYHHYEKDIETMASYGLNTFRFTIQWARFMKDPVNGIVSEDAVKFYRNVARKIRSCGMQPLISLEHWDIPAVLYEKYNGWVGRETLGLYEKYVTAALEALHEDVDLWCAFTEPNMPIERGYLDGTWYPFKHAPKEAYQAMYHKILATSLAVKSALKYKDEGLRMGVMIHLTPVYARSTDIRDVQAAYYADLFQVRMFLDPYLKGIFSPELIAALKDNGCMFSYQESDLELINKYRIDILGTDYYYPIRVKARESEYSLPYFTPEKYYETWVMPGRRFNSDRGWEIYPEALEDFGRRIKEDYDNFPWFVSENGLGIMNEDRFRDETGTINDDYRIEFIKQHLQSAINAKNQGSNCNGYLIWSYVDNVSPLNAFKNRYGLLELDLETYERKPKKSLCWMKTVMETGII